MKGRRDRKEAETELLRLKISELLLSGFSERAIAKAVNRSASTVHHHVVVLLKRWRQAQAANTSKWVGRQLSSLAYAEAEAIGAWERSKAEPRREVTLRARGRALRRRRDRPLKVDETSFVDVSRRVTLIESAGDADFLLVLSRVIELRSELLGLTGTTDEPPAEDAPEVSDYEKARARLLEAVGGRP